MSHYINAEILETLYEEELENFTKENKNLFNNQFTQEEIISAAEIMAYKRFENMSM